MNQQLNGLRHRRFYDLNEVKTMRQLLAITKIFWWAGAIACFSLSLNLWAAHEEKHGSRDPLPESLLPAMTAQRPVITNPSTTQKIPAKLRTLTNGSASASKTAEPDDDEFFDARPLPDELNPAPTQKVTATVITPRATPVLAGLRPPTIDTATPKPTSFGAKLTASLPGSDQHSTGQLSGQSAGISKISTTGNQLTIAIKPTTTPPAERKLVSPSRDSETPSDPESEKTTLEPAASVLAPVLTTDQRLSDPSSPTAPPPLPTNVQRDLAAAAEQAEIERAHQELFAILTAKATANPIAYGSIPPVSPATSMPKSPTTAAMLSDAGPSAREKDDLEICQQLHILINRPIFQKPDGTPNLTVISAELNRPASTTLGNTTLDRTPSTPLQIAASLGYQHTAAFLITHGAEINTTKRVYLAPKVTPTTTTYSQSNTRSSCQKAVQQTAAELACAAGHYTTAQLVRRWDAELLAQLQSSALNGNATLFKATLDQVKLRLSIEPELVAPIKRWLVTPAALSYAARQPDIFDDVLKHQLSLLSASSKLTPEQHEFNLLQTTLFDAVKSGDHESIRNILAYARQTDRSGALTHRLILTPNRAKETVLRTAIEYSETTAAPVLAPLLKTVNPANFNPTQLTELKQLADNVHRRNLDPNRLAQHYLVRGERAPEKRAQQQAVLKDQIEQDYAAVQRLFADYQSRYEQTQRQEVQASTAATNANLAYAGLDSADTITKFLADPAHAAVAEELHANQSDAARRNQSIQCQARQISQQMLLAGQALAQTKIYHARITKRRNANQARITAACNALNLAQLAQKNPDLLTRNWASLQATKQQSAVACRLWRDKSAVACQLGRDKPARRPIGFRLRQGYFGTGWRDKPTISIPATKVPTVTPPQRPGPDFVYKIGGIGTLKREHGVLSTIKPVVPAAS